MPTRQQEGNKLLDGNGETKQLKKKLEQGAKGSGKPSYALVDNKGTDLGNFNYVFGGEICNFKWEYICKDRLFSSFFNL